MWAWSIAFGAWTMRACPILSARRWRTASKPRCDCWTNTVVSISTLVKRTVGPFVAAVCQPAMANEAVQRRAAYLNGRRDDLYDLSLYLVLLYEAPHVARSSTELRRLWQAPREALRAWLSPDHTLQLLESELDRAIGALQHKARALEVQIGDFGPTRLEKQDAFRFFRELVNYAPAVVDAARLTHDTHLDYFVSDSFASQQGWTTSS